MMSYSGERLVVVGVHARKVLVQKGHHTSMLVISGGGNPSPNIFSVKGHYALNVSWFYRVSWHNLVCILLPGFYNF